MTHERSITIDTLPDVYQSDVFEPHERGSVSTYASRCGKYVQLQTAERLAKIEAGTDSVREGGNFYITRGVVFHTLESWRLKDSNVQVTFNLTDQGDKDAVAAGYQLWNAYRKAVPRSAFGTVIFNETMFPRTMEERGTLERNVVMAPFKLVVDAVVRLGDKEVKWWREHGAALPGPGVYVIDHKSSSRKRAEEFYTMSHQSIAYQHGLESLRMHDQLPEISDPIRGMIYNMVVTTKTPQFFAYFAPPPGQDDIAMLRRDFAAAAKRIENGTPDGYSCVSEWGRLCKFFENGDCNRV